MERPKADVQSRGDVGTMILETMKNAGGRGFWALAIAVLAITGTINSAAAELRVNITQGSANPLPIAVTNFIGQGREAEIGRNIANVISGRQALPLMKTEHSGGLPVHSQRDLETKDWDSRSTDSRTDVEPLHRLQSDCIRWDHN